MTNASELLEGTTPGPWELRGPTLIYGNLQRDMNQTGDKVASMVSANDARLCVAAPDLARQVTQLEAQLAEMREVLVEAKEALALGAAVPLADPMILVEVRQLGDRHGYGNLMSTASAIWRDKLGDLAGGEFSSGPCRGTARKIIARIDALLTKEPK